MIPHLGMKLAMQRAGGDRAAARGLIRASIVAEAARQVDEEVVRAGRSLNCANAIAYLHEDHGCRNDGSTCLCECHDATSPAYAYQKDAG